MPDELEHEVRIPASRLDALREKLDRGESIEELDCKAIAQMQALDVVELGRNFAIAEAMAWNDMLKIDEALQEARKRDILERAGINVS